MIGGATLAGTAKFRLEHELMKYVKFPKSGLEVSRLGMGTFRLPEQNAEELVLEAIANGINIFDCAPNFQKGRSEVLLGKGLRRAISTGVLERSQFLLVGKCGFLPKDSQSFPNTYITNNVPYSIHPAYIEHQITKSIANLGVNHLDIFLLSNPERIVHAAGKQFPIERCYEEIGTAFLHLEKEQQRGRITTFGIASNSLALPETPDHLEIEKVLGLGPIGAIQYPLNIFEPDVLEGDDTHISVDDICEEHKIFRMTQRPFLAISSQGVQKLSPAKTDLTESEINSLTTKQFTIVTDLELILGGKLNDLTRFTLANVLAENLSRLVLNPMAGMLYIEREMKPILKRDLEYIQESEKLFDEDEVEQIRQFKDSYELEVMRLFDAVQLIGEYHRNRTNDSINSILRTVGYDSIEKNALAFALSGNRNGTVFMGTTQKSGFEWARNMTIKNDFDKDQLSRIADLSRVAL